MTLIQDPPIRSGSEPAPGAGPDVPSGTAAGAAAPTTASQSTGASPSPSGAAPASPTAGPGSPGAGPGSPGAGSRPSVLLFADSMGRALDHLVATPTWSMSEEELGEALVKLTAEQARLHELRMRVLHEADARRVGHDEGMTSTAAWLAHKTKLTRASISADLHLARALDQEFTLTRAAMTRRHTSAFEASAATAGSAPAEDSASAATAAAADAATDQDTERGGDEPGAAPADAGDVADDAADAADAADADGAADAGDAATGPAPAAPEAAGSTASGGIVDGEKARIIIRAVEGLTQDYGDLVTPEVRRRAEAHLVGLAARFDAPMLKELAKRLVEVICPEAADAAEAKKLDAEEQAARRKAYVHIRDNGDGTSSGSFKLPTLHADLWAKALDELTSPRKLGDARVDPATGRPYSTSTLRGQGFIALLENHLNLERLPGSAGSPFTLVVHVDLDVLETGLGVAAVETGHRISAAEARRLSCNAAIIPMVLGGDSMPLDLGRERRFFSKHQRIALDHTHRGCAADGCDRPPSQVEYHHLHAWHQGGRTDLKDGISLCSPHHHMADHPELWDMTHLPNGAVRFTRRQ